MKQTAAVLALLLLLAVSSQAQVGFGVTGGVNFATVGGADVPSAAKSLTGFAGGAYLEFSIPFLFSIQPEVIYSMKGFSADEVVMVGGTPYNVKATAHLNYIEVPVLIKYTLPVPVIKPALFAGPSLGFLMNAKVKAELAGFPTTETDIKSSTTSTDFGLVFGASANIAIITVSARYTMGLTTLDKEGTSKVYNRVWSLMVGVGL
jgi:hypothetical protein